MSFVFILFLLFFLFIGLSSVRRSRNNVEDYLVAGKAVSPAFVGLSAVATNNSGWMFVGMIGATYAMGLSSVWLMVGWILGDFLVSLIALPALHKASRRSDVHSFGGLLGHWHAQGDNRLLRRCIGVITVVCLTVYAAAQLKAGSKATTALLGWHPHTGIVISALIVLAYSAVGGIRASIWTDVAQSIVMLVGMGALVVGGLWMLQALDGPYHATAMQLFGGEFGAWFPQKPWWGVVLFITGWLFGGIGVIGQPHIVIRFISLDSAHHLWRMRAWYYFWFAAFYTLTIAAGLLARVMLDTASDFDAEMALPLLARDILPPAMVGLILAALFAATMSTADSLILACSASVLRDIAQSSSEKLGLAKLSTALVLLVAVSIALSGSKTVFALVLDAWGMLSAAFAPLVIVFALGRRLAERHAILVMLLGFAAFLLWPALDPMGYLYASAPAIALGVVVGLLLGDREILKHTYK